MESPKTVAAQPIINISSTCTVQYGTPCAAPPLPLQSARTLIMMPDEPCRVRVREGRSGWRGTRPPAAPRASTDTGSAARQCHWPLPMPWPRPLFSPKEPNRTAQEVQPRHAPRVGMKTDENGPKNSSPIFVSIFFLRKRNQVREKIEIKNE